MEVYVGLARLRNVALVNAGIYRIRLALLPPEIGAVTADDIAVVTYQEGQLEYACRELKLPGKILAERREKAPPENNLAYSSPLKIDYEEEDVYLNESALFHANVPAMQLQSAGPFRLQIQLEYKGKDEAFSAADPQIVELLGDRFGLNNACTVFFNDANFGCAVLDLVLMSSALQLILDGKRLCEALFEGEDADTPLANESSISRVQRRIASCLGPCRSSLAMLESLANQLELSFSPMADDKSNQEPSSDDTVSIRKLSQMSEEQERNEAPKRVLLFNSIIRKYDLDLKTIAKALKGKWKQSARDVSAELFIREKFPIEKMRESQDTLARNKEYRRVAEKLRTAPRFTEWDASSRPLTGARTFTDESGRPVVFEQRFESSSTNASSTRRGSISSLEAAAMDDGIHLVILIHGFMGSKWDLRVPCLALAALDIPNLRVKSIESNHHASEWPLIDQGVNAAGEICAFAKGKNITKLSFIAYSMGAVVARVALNQPCMRQFDDRLYTFVSIAGPHLGTLGSDSGLVGFGQWALTKWKKIKSLEQLSLEDDTLLNLSENSAVLGKFSHVALVSSMDDTYVPAYSARMEVPAHNKYPVVATMQENLLRNALSHVPCVSRIEMTFEFAARRSARARVDAMLGRAAHIHILDSLPLSLTLILIFAAEWFT